MSILHDIQVEKKYKFLEVKCTVYIHTQRVNLNQFRGPIETKLRWSVVRDTGNGDRPRVVVNWFGSTIYGCRKVRSMP